MFESILCWQTEIPPGTPAYHVSTEFKGISRHRKSKANTLHNCNGLAATNGPYNTASRPTRTKHKVSTPATSKTYNENSMEKLQNPMQNLRTKRSFDVTIYYNCFAPARRDISNRFPIVEFYFSSLICNATSPCRKNNEIM